MARAIKSDFAIPIHWVDAKGYIIKCGKVDKMTDKISPEQVSEKIWWPWPASFGVAFLTIWIHPYLAISLGLMLLFLNWLRMGKCRNVVLISFLSLCFIALWRFTDYRNSNFDLLGDWSLAVEFGRITVILLAIGLLASLGWKDVREFVARGGTPLKISGWTGLLLATSLFGIYYLTGVGLDAISRSLGSCQFPTIYELAARREESQAEGLRALFARRTDLGCGFTWKHSRLDIDPVFTFSGEPVFFYSWNEKEQLFYIEQIITTKEDFDPSVIDTLPYFWGDPLDLTLPEIPQADFYESRCFDDGLVKECAVLVGFDHLVYGLDVRSGSTDQDQFETVVNTALAKAVERILAYEATLP